MDAASDPPPVTIARINALPSGLLEMIFRYFQPRPLLFIVSLVCRRWRGAALRTVTYLNLTPFKLANPLARGLLANLSGLQTVDFWSKTPESPVEPALALPASVTSLVLYARRATSLQCLVLPAVVRALELNCVRVLPTLPPSLWLTLEKLSIGFGSIDRRDTAQIAALQSAHLPSLHSLQLQEGWGAELLPLLRRHDTQLTDLNLSGCTGIRLMNKMDGNFGDLRLTRLHTLRLEGGPNSPFTAELVTTLLSRAPNLRALTLWQLSISKVPPALLTALVALKIAMLDPKEAALLDSLPRLRCIVTAPNAYVDCSAITLSRLTLIQLRNPQYATIWPLLTSAKSASTVQLVYEGNAWAAIADATNDALSQAPCLLHLRGLLLQFRDLALPFNSLAALLRAWHTIAPRLASINIQIKRTSEVGDISALRGVVRSGAQRTESDSCGLPSGATGRCVRKLLGSTHHPLRTEAPTTCGRPYRTTPIAVTVNVNVR